MFGLWLGLCVVCAIVCAMIYSSKGLPATGGVLLGAILGPIGLLLALIVSGPASAPTSRRCPFCAEPIQAAAVVCKHCGRDLPTLTAEHRSTD